MDADLADLMKAHMALMRRCNSQADAVAWMARAYNLMDACVRDMERPKVYQIPGSYGELFYTVAIPEKLVLPEQRRIITPHEAWINAKTVEYGGRYQNRAWTHKDTLRLERENARRAAENFTRNERQNRQKGPGR